MTRALLIIRGEEQRQRAIECCKKAPEGTRLAFKEIRRSTEQNDRMWAMLTDISKQAIHAGRKFSADQWKILFMHACGREVQFLPALDGSTFIPWGQRSSDLSKAEMSELMAFMEAWGAEHGVTFHWQAATERVEARL